MIHRIYIDNFRCLVNFDLKLEHMTLLLGPNGAGKTTVFEAINRLRTLIAGEGRIAQLFPGSELTRWNSAPSLSFRLQVGAAGRDSNLFAYSLTLGYAGEPREPYIQAETLTLGEEDATSEVTLFECVHGAASLYDDLGAEVAKYPCDPALSALAAVPDRPGGRLLAAFKQLMAQTYVVGVNPFAMRSASPKAVRHPDRLMTDYASWYRHLVQEQQSNMADLAQEMRDVLPGFSEFRLVQLAEGYRSLHVIFAGGKVEGGDPVVLDFASLSDGQRALVALYTLLHGLKGQGCTLLVEEPENFVSLDEIQPWVMAAFDLCGSEIPQIVLTSHHPEVINYLGGYALWIERSPNDASHPPKTLAPDESGITLSETIARGWVE